VGFDGGRLAALRDEAHLRLVGDGVEATTIERGNIHDSFTVTGPSGYSIPINSSHVAGIV